MKQILPFVCFFFQKFYFRRKFLSFSLVFFLTMHFCWLVGDICNLHVTFRIFTRGLVWGCSAFGCFNFMFSFIAMFSFVSYTCLTNVAIELWISKAKIGFSMLRTFCRVVYSCTVLSFTFQPTKIICVLDFLRLSFFLFSFFAHIACGCSYPFVLEKLCLNWFFGCFVQGFFWQYVFPFQLL